MRWTLRLTTATLLSLMLTVAVCADPMRILMVGPPGAGKGTQAKQLSKHFRLAHISTGAMLRDHISRSTPLGLKAKQYVESGELVPNDVIVKMLAETLKGNESGYILDGFPRNLKQAESLDGIMDGLNQELTAVVQLAVPDDVVVKRLLSRGRTDDTEEVIRRRLEIYSQDTAPILRHYEKNGKVVEVDGVGSIEEVQVRIRERLTPQRWFQ